MRNVARSIAGPSRPTPAHQQLALAVIIQAINDARKPEGKLSHEARHFLTNDATLSEWCGVAGLDPDFVRSVIRRSLGR
jgi:hypothetical protein